jgi:hypothetical protein
MLVFYREDHQIYTEKVLKKSSKKLKAECCYKYQKGKRCKDCPCFDMK